MLGTLGILLATSGWLLAPPLVLYGIGMVGSVNSAGDIVLHRGGAGSRAVGSLRQTSDLGLVIGPIAAGALADAFSFRVPFLVFPVLMLVAAVGVIVPNLRSARTSMEHA
jgi:MFS family permease